MRAILVKKFIFLFVLVIICINLKNEVSNPEISDLLKYRIEYVIADENEKIEIENTVKNKFKDLDVELIKDGDLKEFLFNCRKER